VKWINYSSLFLLRMSPKQLVTVVQPRFRTYSANCDRLGKRQQSTHSFFLSLLVRRSTFDVRRSTFDVRRSLVHCEPKLKTQNSKLFAVQCNLSQTNIFVTTYSIQVVQQSIFIRRNKIDSKSSIN